MSLYYLWYYLGYEDEEKADERQRHLKYLSTEQIKKSKKIKLHPKLEDQWDDKYREKLRQNYAKSYAQVVRDNLLKGSANS